MIQFITNPLSPLSASLQALAALRGGCKWVEINMPDATFDHLQKEIEEVRATAEKNEAFLLITNHAEWAKDLNVGGVHLTDKEVSPSRTRVLIGAAGVVGVDVNSFDEVEALRNYDIDYVVITPFATTQSSLGAEGVTQIVGKMHNNDIEIASVASGGINADNIKEALDTGINGVAIYNDIADAEEIETSMRKLISIVGKP